MLQWGVLPKGGFIGSLKAGHWLMPQVGDYGLLLYPLVAATILDSYRLPLIIQQRVALILTRTHHACTIGRVDFSAEPSVRIMQYGSVTLKSAVTARVAESRPSATRFGGSASRPPIFPLRTHHVGGLNGAPRLRGPREPTTRRLPSWPAGSRARSWTAPSRRAQRASGSWPHLLPPPRTPPPRCRARGLPHRSSL